MKLEDKIKGRYKRDQAYQVSDYRRRQKEEDWVCGASVYTIVVQRCVITLDQMLQWEGKVV